MKPSEELKNKIRDQINSLDDDVLEEFYGHIKNFINSKSEIDIWESLSLEQQNGIKSALAQIDRGERITHNQVMSNIRQRFPNAK